MKRMMMGLFVALMLIFSASPARADLGHVRKVNSLAHRAMGGLDLTLDNQIPANAALEPDGWNLSLLNVEAGGNVMEYLRSSSWLNKTSDFMDEADAMIDGLNERRPDMAEINKMMANYRDLMLQGHYSFTLRSRAEVLSLRLGDRKHGHFLLGAYGEGDTAFLVEAPNPDKTEFRIGIRSGKLDGWADLGAPRDVMKGRGHIDAGSYLGYGHAFQLSEKVDLGAGAKLRVFHRWIMPSAIMSLPQEVRRKRDLKSFPEGVEVGTGFDVDLSTVLDARDRYLNAKFALALENLGSVWYKNGAMSETPRFSVGTSFAPFHALGHDKFVLGLEIEDMTSDGPALQLGLLYTMLGNEMVNISPRAGFIFNEKTLFGESSTIFTTGLSFHFLSLNLVGLYEYDVTHGIYGLGAGLEWVLF